MCEKTIETYKSLEEKFMRHLSANADVSELSKHFGALNSNFERVEFAGELLKVYDFKLPFCDDTKDESLAVKFRERGNDMFKAKKLKEAWELYTKSVLFSKETGGNLSLGYANRSAVLLEAQLFEACLEDIARALSNNYPEMLKEKLLVRKGKAEKHKTGPSEPYHETVPSVEAKHCVIECACDNVEIRDSELFGRFIAAARDIKPGEILAVESPFTSILVDQTLSHCHECINLCYNLIPCKSCTQALYCSEDCRLKAFETYHKHECHLLKTLKLLQLDKLKLLSLKIAFLASKIDDVPKRDKYLSGDYHEIHNLTGNTLSRSIPDLFARALIAALIYELVERKTVFFQHCTTQAKGKFQEILLLHMQTGPCNFHQISELAPGPFRSLEPREIGGGAYAFLSLLNHSCSPNVTRFCYGSVIVLRAIKSIRKGEQCFDNYGFHYALLDRVDRMKSLKMQYYFECSCQACVECWNLYDNLNDLGDDGIGGGVLQKLSAGDVGTARWVVQDALNNLERLQEREPCKNFCDMQEIVKQCFALFGNKRRLF